MMSQIVALSIFVVMFAFIISGKVHRHIPALVGAACTLVLVFLVCMHSPEAAWKTLNLECFLNKDFWYAPGAAESSSSGINWSTIVFFIGMMIMVEGMGIAGFFRWLCLDLAKKVHYKVAPLFISFMLLSAVLAMFIDSITVVLFMAAITVELSLILKFNPVYMILPEIFCANLGGAATMSGDPPNIIIGTSLGFTFTDFLFNTGLVVLIALVLVVLFYYFRYHKKLKSGGPVDHLSGDLDPAKAIKSKPAFVSSLIIFLVTVVLLVTHAQTGVTVASIGALAGVLTLVVFNRHSGKILKGVDWETVLFFTGLFVVVGGLEETGILEILSQFIGNISGGNPIVMIMVILWVSAVASAFVDNIPFAATMVPVIRSLSATSGVELSVLAWALALGTDIGGNGTPIGASANVIGCAIAEKNGHRIGWGSYLMSAIPATLLVLAVCSIYLIARYL